MEQRRGQIDALNGIFRNKGSGDTASCAVFISYIVIRLVIRSRNTYYSTLRTRGDEAQYRQSAEDRTSDGHDRCCSWWADLSLPLTTDSSLRHGQQYN